MKQVKNIMKYQVYKKKSMILSCNILMICLDFFLQSKLNTANF